MKSKAIFFLLVLLLLLTSGFIPSCRESNAAIVFPDVNLERFIRQAINQHEGDISPESLENLVKLDISTLLIQDLTGIESCKNLTELNIENNEIVDISPLSSLKKLEVLNLSLNPISDLSPITGCPVLNNLTINDVSVPDFSLLSELVSLRILELKQFDFDVLNIKRLKDMDTGNYIGIEDITSLADLVNLTELSLEFYFIEDVSPLAGLTDLEILSLRYNKITDTSPLTGLKNLTNLRLDNNPITNLGAWIDYIPAEGQYLRISFKECPLSETSVSTYIPLMEEAGIRVER
jgi:internalin A